MLIDLTPAQIEEAVAYGKAKKDATVLEFVKEWVADLGPEVGYATVDTRFKEIARVARSLALKDKELSLEGARTILGGISSANLNFSITVYDSTRDFAKNYEVILRHQGKFISPRYEHTPPIARERLNGTQGYVVTCISVFPIKEIDINSKVILELIEPPGEKKLKFTFDLSKMH